MSARIKFCGLTKAEDIQAASDIGAAYVGFVNYPKSPRYVGPEAARALALTVPPGIAKVALMVDPSDAALEEYLARVPIDMVQLHGAETPERVGEIRQQTGLPVMKALGIAGPDDIVKIAAYSRVADQILVDAKAPKDAALPGGNGVSFDWSLLAQVTWTVPWMLAGGLTVANVAKALRITGAQQVDLSSGVERVPGDKDPVEMARFAKAISAC